MTLLPRIRRLSEQIVRGATLLGWYYRTRPDALRFLAAPVVAALLVVGLAGTWGLPAMILLALAAVGAFAVFAVPFIKEIDALEKQAADLDAGPFPWLVGMTGPGLVPVGEAPALKAEEPTAATDLAFGPIVQRDPAHHEIGCTTGDTRQAAATHSHGQPTAELGTARRHNRNGPAARPPTLTEIFGFDPVRWVGPPSGRRPRKR